MTLTNNVNYLQPTGFKLVIDRKKFGNIEFFAQSVTHPSVSIPAAEVPFSRVNTHFAGDKLTFGSLSANIIVDENLNGYIEMFNWVKRLVQENQTSRTFVDSDQFPTSVDITLSVLSSHNNTTKRIKYVDCVPTEIGDLNFISSSGSTDYLTFPVTFAFTYFDIL